MDLTSFVSKKLSKSKEIISDKNLKIEQLNDEEIVFNIKSKDELSKLNDFLFFSPTNSIIARDEAELEEFFNESIKDGTEGVMVKSLNAKYKPGIRTGSMAKLKEVKEDLDVVVIGAEYGKGKRAGFYSSFIVGVRDELSDEFLEIGKVSSGIKELENEEGISLDKITKLLKPLKTGEKDNKIFFEPRIILQVRYQEIQKSTTYSSGFALRFPRIIMLREDKSVEEINSVDDISRFIN